MAVSPSISVVVSTYQRPEHLRRCLLSLARQRNVDGLFEVVVTDDGSTDGTAALVEGMRQEVPYSLHWVTQPQEGFRLARCRNNGVRTSSAPYLLFTDGDCVFDQDHLARHLQAQQPGVARAGMCVWLDQETSEQIDYQTISSGLLEQLANKHRAKMRRSAAKAAFYQLTGNPTRPKLIGANMAVARSDYDLVNGFDEAFVGWGCEDDDFAMRLRQAGVKIQTVLHRTFALHCWHPPHATTPQSWSDGANVEKLQQPVRLTSCFSGMQRRSIHDLSVRVMNRRSRWFHWAFTNGGGLSSVRHCEIELLVLPGAGEFSANGDCRILIAEPGCEVPTAAAEAADVVLHSSEPLQAAEQLYRLLAQAFGQHEATNDATSRPMAA